MPTSQIVSPPIELSLPWQVVQTFRSFDTAYVVALVADEEHAQTIAAALNAARPGMFDARPVDADEALADYADRLLRRFPTVTTELADRGV